MLIKSSEGSNWCQQVPEGLEKISHQAHGSWVNYAAAERSESRLSWRWKSMLAVLKKRCSCGKRPISEIGRAGERGRLGEGAEGL